MYYECWHRIPLYAYTIIYWNNHLLGSQNIIILKWHIFIIPLEQNIQNKSIRSKICKILRLLVYLLSNCHLGRTWIYIQQFCSQHKRKTSHHTFIFFLALRLLSIMTQAEIKLCSLLLQEHFGEIVEKIGVHLIRTGSQPLRVIAHDTGTSLDQVCLDHINLLSFH